MTPPGTAASHLDAPLTASLAAIDPRVPDKARRYDYWLGGKDNFAADRASGDAIEEIHPNIKIGVAENRKFLGRVVTCLATEAGIRQFLDIGTGIPTPDNNTHQIAQTIAPDSRVVYVDNDKVVMTHARALLKGTPQGETAYLEADLRDPDTILAGLDQAGVLDLSQPVALLLIAVLHFLTDADHPYAQVACLLEALPSGSYLALSHATTDPMPASTAATMRNLGQSDHDRFQLRTRARIEPFLTGLELLDPGIVSVADWRPDPGTTPPKAADVCCYGVLARVP